jgi:hypothetical protein
MRRSLEGAQELDDCVQSQHKSNNANDLLDRFAGSVLHERDLVAQQEESCCIAAMVCG